MLSGLLGAQTGGGNMLLEPTNAVHYVSKTQTVRKSSKLTYQVHKYKVCLGQVRWGRELISCLIELTVMSAVESLKLRETLKPSALTWPGSLLPIGGCLRCLLCDFSHPHKQMNSLEVEMFTSLHSKLRRVEAPARHHGMTRQ